MSRGAATRTVLIETAERLFAERGLEAVSMRDVSAVAGQRNTSAVIYHFGDRAGLLAAVLEWRLAVINTRRAELLAAFDDAGRGDSLTAAVEALVIPAVEVVCGSGGWYGRFAIRCQWSELAVTVVDTLPSATLGLVVLDRIKAALPHLPPGVRRFRLSLAQHHFLSGLADWEWSRDRGRRLLAAEVLAAELVATTLAILEAPHARNVARRRS